MSTPRPEAPPVIARAPSEIYREQPEPRLHTEIRSIVKTGIKVWTTIGLIFIILVIGPFFALMAILAALFAFAAARNSP
jgi:hypothetical protein